MLTEILDVSAADNRNYITSTDNPVDDDSRSYDVKQMNSSSRRLNGPSFPMLPNSGCPNQVILKTQNLNVLTVNALQRYSLFNRIAFSGYYVFCFSAPSVLHLFLIIWMFNVQNHWKLPRKRYCFVMSFNLPFLTLFTFFRFIYGPQSFYLTTYRNYRIRLFFAILQMGSAMSSILMPS